MQLIGPLLFIDTWVDWPVSLAWLAMGLSAAALSYVFYRKLKG